MRVLSLVTVLTLSCSITTALAAPARADDLGTPPTFPAMHLTITPSGSAHQVCASGSVSASAPVPTWSFAIVASTGYAPDPVVRAGRTFYHCDLVVKTVPIGNHSEVFAFGGSVNETAFMAFANGTWNPGGDNFVTTAP